MGSGRFGEAGWTDACFLSNLRLQTATDGTMADFNGIGSAEISGYFDYRLFMQSKTSWGSYMYVGGPGAPRPAELLMYDRNAGAGSFYNLDEQGSIELLNAYNNWRQSWSRIVSSNFSGNQFADLLFYYPSAGVGEFYTTDELGNITLLKTLAGWRAKLVADRAGQLKRRTVCGSAFLRSERGGRRVLYDRRTGKHQSAEELCRLA